MNKKANDKIKRILFSVLGAIALLLLAACAFGVLPNERLPLLNHCITTPWIALLVFLSAGTAIWFFFYYVVGVRGKGLKYVTIVILFTIMCIWLYKNFGPITEFLETNLGTWGMIGVLAVLIIVVGIGLYVLF
jgi:hypothetical protein